MTAQELLDALNKAQNETNLDQVAVWALSKYLQGAWKNSPGRNFRAYDLGQALSDFFVDLSLHRLPEKITKQTPQTEKHLLEYYGVDGNGLSQFWARCIEIWNVTLEPYPAYAKEVKKYFDLLLQSSLRGNRLDSAVDSVKPSVEPKDKPPVVNVPATSVSAIAPETPAAPPASPAPVVPELPVEPAAPVAAKPPVEPPGLVVTEPPVEPPAPAAAEAPVELPAPVAAEPINKPEQADVPAPQGSGNEPVPSAQMVVPKSEPESKTLPRNAYLVLQGTRVIPLNRSFIKIGRQLDNHIILADPRVSRAHAQIKLIKDRFVIFDMNSTGGTFVNGQPTSQSVLYPGDVVSLAGVVFIFSQEMPAKPGDMKIIELGSPFAADRPTAILRKEELKQAKKIAPKDLPDLPKTGPLKR